MAFDGEQEGVEFGPEDEAALLALLRDAAGAERGDPSILRRMGSVAVSLITAYRHVGGELDIPLLTEGSIGESSHPEDI